MRTDPIKEYVRLKKTLLREKGRIESKLAEINEVLKSDSEGATVERRLKALRTKPRIRNAISLREAVRRVTAKKPLTKKEILIEVKKLGYEFSSENPINSLGTVLYSNKLFKNKNGRFSPA